MSPLPIQEQSALLSAIFAHSPDGMAFIDPNLVIRAANDTFAKQIGVPLPQIIGRPGQEIMPNWQEQVGYTYRAVRETGKAFTAEALPFAFKGQPKRGVTFWNGSLSPIYGGDDTFLGYLLIQREVTERKRAEETLRESEERYRLLVESIPDAVWIADEEGNATFISRSIERICGYSPEEFYKEGRCVWLGRIHAEDVGRVREAYRLLFVTGKAFDLEYRSRRKDGKWIWLHDRSITTFQEGGKRYARGIVSDITRRKEAEAERNRLAAVIEGTPDFVGLADVSGHNFYLNKAARRMLGITKDEDITGRMVSDNHPA